MKSKELKTYNLPSDSFFISEINAKPTVLFLLITFVGFVSLFFNSVPKVFSITITIVGFICVCLMPRVVLIEFYNDYMVLYNKADKNTCEIIYYDEVESWYYNRGTTKDYLIINMMDGSSTKIEAFSKTIFEVNVSRYLKDKHIKKQ